MKAIVLEATGGVEQLQLQEIPRPEIQAHEVLVEVKVIGVNPVDYKVRANDEVLTMIYGPERPAILGWDIAGNVVAKGDAVQDLEIGDRVFGMVNFVGAGNAYAEFVAAPETHLARIPDGVSFENAAASTLAALTAWQVLHDKVTANDRVLIHAGSGGVGHFAIQIAKSLGAHVITTTSAKNKDFVLALGADECIDYRTQRFEEEVSEIDFVFDMFNGEVLANSVKVMRNGGTIISIPTPDFSDEIQTAAQQKEVQLGFHMVQSSRSDMQKIATMLAGGTLKPHVSQTFAFEEMVSAHRQLESGRTVGKVVVVV